MLQDLLLQMNLTISSGLWKILPLYFFILKILKSWKLFWKLFWKFLNSENSDSDNF